MEQDQPGVYIPPPFIYASVFLFSVLLQKLFPFNDATLRTNGARMVGWVFVALAAAVVIPALIKFARSKNTLVTVRPARSLQTNGIYSFTRNPMYLGLLLFYIGIAAFLGNWWTLLLLPGLVLIVTRFVIRREERYLSSQFGASYQEYCKRVRRWI